MSTKQQVFINKPKIFYQELEGTSRNKSQHLPKKKTIEKFWRTLSKPRRQRCRIQNYKNSINIENKNLKTLQQK